MTTTSAGLPRRIGRQAAEILVDAMVTGVWAGDSKKLSLAATFPKMAAMEEDLFIALDADADGVISRDESSKEAMREARRTTMKSRMFERADTDADPRRREPHRAAGRHLSGGRPERYAGSDPLLVRSGQRRSAGGRCLVQ